MRIVSLILLIALAISPVKAGFFDGLFGGGTDTKDKGSFYIKVEDQLGNNNEISHSERKVRIRLFYDRQYFSRIDNFDEDDLEEAFNRALTVRTQLVKDGPKEKLGQNLSFSLKSVKDDDINNQYDEVVFESSSIIIDKSQKVFFTFDIQGFIDDIGITIFDLAKDTSEKIINYSPINIELTSAELVLDESQPKADDDAFSPQIVSISFLTAYDLDLTQQSLSFDLYRKKKLLEALAKKSGKKYKLSLSSEQEEDFISSLGSGNFQLSVPVSIKPKLAKQLKLFQRGITYKVVVPVLIDTYTSTGLEVKVKILAKAKLS